MNDDDEGSGSQRLESNRPTSSSNRLMIGDSSSSDSDEVPRYVSVTVKKIGSPINYSTTGTIEQIKKSTLTNPGEFEQHSPSNSNSSHNFGFTK